MSLWDFVAAASISTNINNPTSNSAKALKKINSATLSVLNGDSVNYVSGGGRTSNTFGASTNFTCDLEALLEGYFAGKFHADPLSRWSMLFGGLLLGPGAENKVLMGNATVLTYMPQHSSNFTVYRGGAPESHSYANWKQTCSCIEWSATLFALGVFVFELLYTFAGINEGMKPIGDSKYYSTKQAEIQAKNKEISDLEKKQKKLEYEQEQREKSGDVPSPEEQEAWEFENESIEKELEKQEEKLEDLENTLKTAERQKEWILYTNVILENRGMYLLKILEKLNASLMKAKVAVANAEEKVANLEKKLETTEESIQTQTGAMATAASIQAAAAIQKEIDSLNTAKAETEKQLQTAKDELKAAKDGVEAIQKKP
jgi:hypothetical protein